MEYITTFLGEDFVPFEPNPDQIHIEDIAHALSLMCRANGHIKSFYSIAQHSINCANEAMARKCSEKIQLACLLHDASEAYISDLTRPVKKHLYQYQQVEKRLQDVIFSKYLNSALTDYEKRQIDKIDYDMLICEFDSLMNKKVFNKIPEMKSYPCFDFKDFNDVKIEFLNIYLKKIMSNNFKNEKYANIDMIKLIDKDVAYNIAASEEEYQAYLSETAARPKDYLEYYDDIFDEYNEYYCDINDEDF